MCRHLGYVGPPISLHDLLVAPPFGLEHQSYAPRHQAHGLVNADGWGVGWYVDGEAAPARYRTARPMWADTSFAGMAGHVRTTVAVASVRSATPPAPVEESGVAPFRAGRILFAHNGVVRGFAEGVGTELRRRLAPPTESRLEGRSDSEVLFGLLLDTLDDGADLTGGLARRPRPMRRRVPEGALLRSRQVGSSAGPVRTGGSGVGDRGGGPLGVVP